MKVYVLYSQNNWDDNPVVRGVTQYLDDALKWRGCNRPNLGMFRWYEDFELNGDVNAAE